MSAIHVCSLARLGHMVEETGARHIVTLINAGTEVIRPSVVPEANHLFIGMNDINAPMAGYIAPNDSHIGRFLSFVRAWNEGAATPIIIHCYAGVSRSTAGAFSAALMLRPHWNEMRLAQHIRTHSPSATPNRLIVEICDRTLGRDGRMVAAVDAIGRGADAYEGVPFMIDLNADFYA